MLTVPITFEGFDGEKTENFYFNLNKVEANRFVNGPIGKKIQKIAADATAGVEIDQDEAIQAIEQLVLLAYGKREGENFVKNNTVAQEFKGSLPFGELVQTLLTANDKMEEFFVGIMPKDVRSQVSASMKEAAGSEPELATAEPVVVGPKVPEGVDVEARTITKHAVINMPSDEAQHYLREGFSIVD